MLRFNAFTRWGSLQASEHFQPAKRVSTCDLRDERDGIHALPLHFRRIFGIGSIALTFFEDSALVLSCDDECPFHHVTSRILFRGPEDF
jgi:hypothetical protein